MSFLIHNVIINTVIIIFNHNITNRIINTIITNPHSRNGKSKVQSWTQERMDMAESKRRK